MRNAPNWQAAAYNTRAAAALPLALREKVFAAVAQRCADEIYAALPEGIVDIHAQPEVSATIMSLGGWSEIFQRALGLVPESSTNDLGIPTNPAWYARRVLEQNYSIIRNAAIRRLQSDVELSVAIREVVEAEQRITLAFNELLQRETVNTANLSNALYGGK